MTTRKPFRAWDTGSRERTAGVIRYSSEVDRMQSVIIIRYATRFRRTPAGSGTRILGVVRRLEHLGGECGEGLVEADCIVGEDVLGDGLVAAMMGTVGLEPSVVDSNPLCDGLWVLSTRALVEQRSNSAWVTLAKREAARKRHTTQYLNKAIAKVKRNFQGKQCFPLISQDGVGAACPSVCTLPSRTAAYY